MEYARSLIRGSMLGMILIVLGVVLAFYSMAQKSQSTSSKFRGQAILLNGNSEEFITQSKLVIPKSRVNARILMYHYIRDGVDPNSDPLGYNLSITPAQFETHLQLFNRLGYKPISMQDAIAGKGTEKSLVLTFDDGYKDFYTNAFPLLQKYGWTGTAYIISGFRGDQYMNAQELKEIAAAGIEIGAHSISHPNLATATPERQEREIAQSKLNLEKLLGISVTTFAYPAGKYSDITIALVRQAGFTSAVTTNYGIASPDDDAYALPRLRIKPTMTLEDLQRELQ